MSADYIINWDEFLIPYKQAVDELVVKLTGVAEEYRKAGVHSPIERVEGRVKRIGSILDKATRKSILLSEIGEKIEDIAGVRIVCRFIEDIDEALAILRKRDGFDIKIKEERNYINPGKTSGYQSYHVLFRYSVMNNGAPKEIWAEAQIRTLAMNFWAIIEHTLKYKYHGNIPEDIQLKLLYSAVAASKLDSQMSKIRHEITEAHETILVKNDLVDSIFAKIQSLHIHAKFDKLHEINKLHCEFMDIYQENEQVNIAKLLEFNEKVNTLARVYCVEHT